jgi:hypothetical protein
MGVDYNAAKVTSAPGVKGKVIRRNESVAQFGAGANPVKGTLGSGPPPRSTSSGTFNATGTGGSSTGGAPPPAASFNTNVQANPYLAKAFGYFDELWGKSKGLYDEALDPTSAIQNYQDMRAQGLKEVEANAGSRGFGRGTGMTLAQQGNYLAGSQQGEQELAADWRNKGLQFQSGLLGQMTGLLGGMTGAGNAIAGNQLGLLGQGLEQQKFGLDAWYKSNMLPIEMERAKSNVLTSQLSALSSIASML